MKNLLLFAFSAFSLISVKAQCTTTNATSCVCEDGTNNCYLLPDITASWQGISNNGFTEYPPTGAGTTTAIAHQFTGGTNGVTVISTMLNNGNVGIGTTAPQSPLSVQKNQNDSTNITLINQDTGTSARTSIRLFNDTSNNLNLLSVKGHFHITASISFFIICCASFGQVHKNSSHSFKNGKSSNNFIKSCLVHTSFQV
jgi:hypothetical protein